MGTVVVDLEGSILKDPDPFAYFMLIAFEASGPTRFGILLLFWPIIRLLEILGRKDVGLKLMIFIAVVGVRISEIEYVSRAVLPKFYMDDLDLGAFRLFSRYDKKVVVTKTPRVMVERFVMDHLIADKVIGSELVVNRFGFATGLVKDVGLFSGRISEFVGEGEAWFHFNCATSKEPQNQPMSSTVTQISSENYHDTNNPLPVIFHDGRLAKKPKPFIALLITLWLPIGIIIGITRMIFLLIRLFIPKGVIPYENILVVGTYIKVKGTPPLPPNHSSRGGGGVLFVCNHRTFGDPVILSHLLHTKIKAVTYSLSRITEFLSPMPTMQLTRNRHVDAEKIKKELAKGHLVICPEGTTCREPFLLRFSALFAELTDQIIPVGLIFRPLFFHPTTARGWKSLDLMFYCMNPITIYEVTFLNKLENEVILGKNSYQIANYVQSLLGETLGFTCTTYTRKDKYRILANNDGIVPLPSAKISWWNSIAKILF
ncbi:hypothetical protein RND81_01G182400 [Saponaria officinalis]|uniref:Phospholipid/glycerol acyltransferase domain-containing protein n=1 Tax=Saponaria officinalis TaxID=3572 RepID=A0AAW1N8H1_SAPOF